MQVVVVGLLTFSVCVCIVFNCFELSKGTAAIVRAEKEGLLNVLSSGGGSKGTSESKTKLHGD